MSTCVWTVNAAYAMEFELLVAILCDKLCADVLRVSWAG